MRRLYALLPTAALVAGCATTQTYVAPERPRRPDAGAARGRGRPPRVPDRQHRRRRERRRAPRARRQTPAPTARTPPSWSWATSPPTASPSDDDPDRAQAEAPVRALIAALAGLEAETIVVPGDRDWRQGDDGVKRLEALIDSAFGGDVLTPGDQSGGPREMKARRGAPPHRARHGVVAPRPRRAARGRGRGPGRPLALRRGAHLRADHRRPRRRPDRGRGPPPAHFARPLRRLPLEPVLGLRRPDAGHELPGPLVAALPPAPRRARRPGGHPRPPGVGRLPRPHPDDLPRRHQHAGTADPPGLGHRRRRGLHVGRLRRAGGRLAAGLPAAGLLQERPPVGRDRRGGPRHGRRRGHVPRRGRRHQRRVGRHRGPGLRGPGRLTRQHRRDGHPSRRRGLRQRPLQQQRLHAHAVRQELPRRLEDGGRVPGARHGDRGRRAGAGQARRRLADDLAAAPGRRRPRVRPALARKERARPGPLRLARRAGRRRRPGAPRGDGALRRARRLAARARAGRGPARPQDRLCPRRPAPGPLPRDVRRPARALRGPPGRRHVGRRPASRA